MKLTPIRAIRLKCLDCCGTANEIKLCTCKTCTLWPYRFGKRPKNDEELEAMRTFEKSVAIYED